ncbi:MAG: osmoprotectant transport system ATP-binding protein [Myxococcota bacterium]|jgi:osmoprotectant transport system ATP-binding protein
MIRLDGITRTFGPIKALDNVTLTLERGRTSVLIGPSGCGKSTLLRLLVGLTWPDAGMVRIDDEPVTPDNVRALRQRIGYVIQSGGLFPHLSGRDNAALLARHLGWEEPRVEARLVALAELTHLPIDALDRFPAQLSGGQGQRVALMRALMLDPDLLLLDEPMGALDPLIRSELQRDLKDIFTELGKTVVLVTHDLSEAVFLGDHLVLLRDGQVVQAGTAEALVRSPEDPFVERFVNAQRSPLEALR